jgi:hypothetical protein
MAAVRRAVFVAGVTTVVRRAVYALEARGFDIKITRITDAVLFAYFRWVFPRFFFPIFTVVAYSVATETAVLGAVALRLLAACGLKVFVLGTVIVRAPPAVLPTKSASNELTVRASLFFVVHAVPISTKTGLSGVLLACKQLVIAPTFQASGLFHRGSAVVLHTFVDTAN